MKRFTIFAFLAALAYALFVAGAVMAGGGHGHGGHGHGGHGHGGHGHGGHGFGGHHGFGDHGFHVSLGLGHHHHSYYSYPYYGYGSYYYPSYYYPRYYYPSYSRYYTYPSDYGIYADSYYCGRPRTVYRTVRPVEAAPPPEEPVETPSVEPAPTAVPDESPNEPGTRREQPRASLAGLSTRDHVIGQSLSQRSETIGRATRSAQGLGPLLPVPAVRRLGSDYETPWVVGEDTRPASDRGTTLATSGPINDRR
jgi:hypothetical protein